MRILIISKYLSSKEVGFEARLFAIARRLSVSNEVTIITSDSNHFAYYPKFKKIYNRCDIGEIKQIVLKTHKYRKTISIHRVLSWIDFEIKLLFYQLRRLEAPDVVIVSSLSLLTILNGFIFKFRFKCKLVFEIRDIWPLTIIEEAGYSRLNPFVFGLDLVETIGYKYADIIVGTMPNLKAHVKNKLPNNQKKIYCIPFGFDEKSTEVIEHKLPILNAIPKDRFIVGYAGSIGISNSLNTLFDCIIDLNAKKSNIHFLIVGSGDLLQSYKEKCSTCTNVTFVPKVERQHVSAVLQCCDLLYFSSSKGTLWNYGWSPNKIIDYMLSGKPILAAYDGFQSMLNEANSGFFIPADNLNALIDKLLSISKMHKDELTTMGLRGKDWILQNRSWDKITYEYLSILNACVSDKS